MEGLKSHSNSQGHEARTNGCLEEYAANKRRRVVDLNLGRRQSTSNRGVISNPDREALDG